MKLLFIRHGQATAYCADDAGRNLTEFGQAQAHETANDVVNHHELDMIIASPFNRADQTAKILQKMANDKGQNPLFITLDTITPDDDPIKGVADIERIVVQHFGYEHDKTVAIVCHMPIVARMVSILNGLPPVMFELAECCALTTNIISEGLSTQIGRFSPKQPEPPTRQ